MRVYTVHLAAPPKPDLVMVREGFSWPAALFAVPWALWHRLWLVALLFLAAQAVLGGLAQALGAGQTDQAALSAGLAAIIGLVANDLRRWTLGRRGFAEAGVVAGSGLEAAEHRFLETRPVLAASLLRSGR